MQLPTPSDNYNSDSVWATFERLRTFVAAHPDMDADTFRQCEQLWQRLYDAACDESPDDCIALTDDQYMDICSFEFDVLHNLEIFWELD